MAWVIKDHLDVSFWHCDRPAYWLGENVVCSKCQEQLPEDN